MAISISEEITGIQTAVTALQAQVATPPPVADSLTPSTQAQLDALATSLNAPTSTSTPPAST